MTNIAFGSVPAEHRCSIDQVKVDVNAGPAMHVCVPDGRGGWTPSTAGAARAAQEAAVAALPPPPPAQPLLG